MRSTILESCLALAAIATLASAQSLVFTQLSTTFNSPVGIDFHEPTNSIILSVNYSGGQPSNLERVEFDGSHSTYSALAGLTDELKIATVRSVGNPAGFPVGDVFTGNGQDGEIVRVTNGGATVMNPWVSLPGTNNGLMRGSLYIDRTGVYGGDLIVCTTNGEVWRVDINANPTFIAAVGTHLEGLATVPNDPVRYGPLAGKIIAGAENQGLLYAFDATGATSTFALGVNVEDIDFIRANEAFIGVNFGTSRLLSTPATSFAGMDGDILLTQEFPSGGSGLYRLVWNGSALVATQFMVDPMSASVGQWEHVTFAPASVAPFPSCTVNPSSNLTATVGQPLSFTITGADAVMVDQVTLTSTALPQGMTLNPPLPAVGNPIAVTANWTPASTGVYSIVFTATDTANLTSACAVTITVGCPQSAAFASYGTGYSGTNGTPGLTPLAPPLSGSMFGIFLDDSWVQPTTAVVLVDVLPANLVFAGVGGTFLVDPFSPTVAFLDFILPLGGLVIPVSIPDLGSLCGMNFFLQAVEYDTGAVLAPYSFTPGLMVTIGS